MPFHDPLLTAITSPLPALMWDLLHIASLSVNHLVARRAFLPYEAFRRQFFGLLVHPLLTMTSVTIGRSACHVTCSTGQGVFRLGAFRIFTHDAGRGSNVIFQVRIS
jgi:hypothetical protein